MTPSRGTRVKRIVAGGLSVYLLLGMSFATADRSTSPASGVGTFAYLSVAWLPVVALKGLANSRPEPSGPGG